jgi:hypothetical protein
MHVTHNALPAQRLLRVGAPWEPHRSLTGPDDTAHSVPSRTGNPGHIPHTGSTTDTAVTGLQTSATVLDLAGETQRSTRWG